MIVLHLYGKYKKEFGDTFNLHVDSLAAAIRLLDVNFKKRFSKLVNEDAFHICEGKTLGKHINIEDEKMIKLEVGDKTVHYHLIPKAVGAMAKMKKKGLGAMLLGAVVLGASFLFGFTPGIYAGLSLILGGASILLTPAAKTAEEDERKSYSLGGPGNQDAQGVVQPVIYGLEVKVGSVVASASIKSVPTNG